MIPNATKRQQRNNNSVRFRESVQLVKIIHALIREVTLSDDNLLNISEKSQKLVNIAHRKTIQERQNKYSSFGRDNACTQKKYDTIR